MNTNTLEQGGNNKLTLQLYVSGMSQKSMEAIENVKRFCEKYFLNAFELEIIDLYKNPDLAAEQHIVFSPSLIKLYPLPRKILVGSFSNTEKIKKVLGVTHKD